MFYRVHKRPLRSVVSSFFRDCLRSVALTEQLNHQIETDFFSYYEIKMGDVDLIQSSCWITFPLTSKYRSAHIFFLLTFTLVENLGFTHNV